MPTASAPLGPATLYLVVNETSTNSAGNYSTFNVQLQLNCSNGQSWTGNAVSFSVTVNGQTRNGTFTFDFRTTNSKLIVAFDITVPHNSDGTKSFSASGSIGSTGTSIPAGSTSTSVRTTNIPPRAPGRPTGGVSGSDFNWKWDAPGAGSTPSSYQIQMATNSAFTTGLTAAHNSSDRTYTWGGIPPATRYYARVRSLNSSGVSGWSDAGTLISSAQPTNAPGTPGVSSGSVTPTGLRITWAAPTDNNGDAPDSYQVQWATNSSFSNATLVSGLTSRAADLTGLPPGTTIYMRVRARNSAGYSNFSGVRTQTTLPSTPPGLIVAAQPSGRVVAVNMSAPSGISGVSKYTVTRTDVVSGAKVVSTFTTSSGQITGLTPGRKYTFSATATIGSYTSPSSTVTTLTMPAPSTSAGSYFDGSTPASGDAVYKWAGTAGLSRSTMNGYALNGWSGAPAGYVSAIRVTGGLFGTYAGVATTIIATSVAPGQFMAQTSSAFDVEENTTYSGSIYVNALTQDATLAPMAYSLDATQILERAQGIGVRVHEKDNWVRLDFTFTTPPGTTRVIFGFCDAYLGTDDTPATSTRTWFGEPNNSGSQLHEGGVDRYNSFQNPAAVGRYASDANTKAYLGWFLGDSTGTASSAILDDNDNRDDIPHTYTRLTFGTAQPTAGGATLTQRTSGDVPYPVAGTIMAFSVYVRSNRDQQVRAKIYWYAGADNTGGTIGANAGEVFTVPAGDDWTRVGVIAYVPAGNPQSMRVYLGRESGVDFAAPWQAGDYLDTTGILWEWGANDFYGYFDGDNGWLQMDPGSQVLFDGAMVILNSIQDYFDGSFKDTPYADYAWLGAAHQSVSSLTPLTPTNVDPLKDPDVTPVPAPPLPPALVDDGIIDIGTWRRYWAQVEASEVSASLSSVPTIDLTTAALPSRQVRIRYWENPDNLAPTEYDFGNREWAAEQIVSYIPANTVMRIDGVSERVWASVNGGDVLPADHLLYGTGGTPAAWPVLSCGVGYLISFDTPFEAPADNLDISVSLTRRM